jgi:hypothetical protein
MLKIRISILFFFVIFVTGCVTRGLVKTHNNPPTAEIKGAFCDTVDSYIFRTTIDLYNNHFSGITVFKCENDSVYRVVFLNEAGMKFFDFRIAPDTFEIVQIFTAMNRKALIQLLINDFRTVLMNSENFENADFYCPKYKNTIVLKPINKRTLYFFDDKTYKIFKIENFSKLRRTCIFNFSYNENLSIQKINIRHLSIRFTMILEKT